MILKNRKIRIKILIIFSKKTALKISWFLDEYHCYNCIHRNYCIFYSKILQACSTLSAWSSAAAHNRKFIAGNHDLFHLQSAKVSIQIGSDHIQEQLDKISESYGPIFTLFLPFPVVVITNYKYFKEAFVTQG